MKPTEVHKKPCKNCPTAHFPPDPENEDVKKWVEEKIMTREEAVFPCGWRPWKLCKGQSDYIGFLE